VELQDKEAILLRTLVCDQVFRETEFQNMNSSAGSGIFSVEWPVFKRNVTKFELNSELISWHYQLTQDLCSKLSSGAPINRTTRTTKLAACRTDAKRSSKSRVLQHPNRLTIHNHPARRSITPEADDCTSARPDYRKSGATVLSGQPGQLSTLRTASSS